MAATNELLSVIEECRISPPPNTVGERSLRVTFFDLLWLYSSPVQPLFFYEFPYSKSHFKQTVIPTLKHSLSITLQHFFPFAGNLIVFPPSHNKKPEIRHVEGDSVALTFAECDHLDFNDLKGNHPREDDELEMFGFLVDWRSRLNPPIPQSYFGNCVWPTFATEKRTLLSSTNGFLNAAELLGKAISKTVNRKNGLNKEVESWSEKFRQGLKITGVAGSPKIKVYDLDFGWGKPKNYEVLSIDNSGSLSISECKESPQDIEVGLSLAAKQMDAFIAIFENELDRISNELAKNE